VGQHVDVVPENTFLEDVYAGLLHLEDRFVDVARFFGEFTRERECSCLRLLGKFRLERVRLRYRRRSCCIRNQRPSRG
jgi:hypothetical protein